MLVKEIKKRDGRIVDFVPEKISVAIGKAFGATRGGVESDKLNELTRLIIQDVEKFFPEKTPGVENIQDLVEKTLMEEGFYDVAKAYILYRYEHAKLREEKKRDVLEKIEKSETYVVKRSGERQKFAFDKLKKSLSYAVAGFESAVDVEEFAVQCRNALYDDIPTKEISRTAVFTARSLIEVDPVYSKVASRLLLSILYKDVIGPEAFSDFERKYREAFVKNIKRGVEIKKLDPHLLEFDLKKLSSKLMPVRDELFYYLGAQTLYDRYFVQNPETREILETPQAFWMRVAMGMALGEKENREEWALRFYEISSSLRFVSSTPTLFHSGTICPQLSSCYLNTVQDSLDDIFKTFADNAQLSKWSGGIGTDWTNVRATGALIKGTGVESQGVIPFLKIANDTTVAINRSGKRRGATCVYLETWHADIEDFIELRKNTGDERRRTHDMDTSNWIPDLFMKRVKEDGDWTLFSPDEVPDLHHIYGRKFEERYTAYEKMAAEGKIRLFRKLRARDLWKKILTMLFETGHPWIVFKDPSNIRSPQDHAGVIHSSNLCTEITLNTSHEETAVCNLGSVNLARHIRGKELDTELLADTVKIAMRMLDNVIDINFYPTKEARNSNLKHRPVGLGIMGFQEALYLMDINFDSERAVEFSDWSMEVISYHAILTSSELARERGAYESFRGSKWDRGIFPVDTLDMLEKERGDKIDVARSGRLDWTPVRKHVAEHGMRNSNCMAMAPTATISNIAGTTSTIEPMYKNLFVKSNQSGDFTVINPYLVEDLKKRGLWDYEMLGKIKYHDGSISEIKEIPEGLRDKYKEVFEINPRWLVKVAAYRGKWIDQSQSLNLYFRGASGKELASVYQYAWEMGLKTTYYLRTLAASQVEKSTLDAAQYGVTHKRNYDAKRVAELQELKAELVSSVAKSADSSPVEHQNIFASSPASREKTPKAMPIPKNLKSGPAPTCRIDDPNCESCQ